MFDATLQVIRLFSATIAVYAQQWRTRGFLIGPPCNWPTGPPPSSSTRSSTIRDAHETRPTTRNRDRDVEISRKGRRIFGQVRFTEEKGKSGGGASGSKCFGVEPSVPLFLYKLRAKYAYVRLRGG